MLAIISWVGRTAPWWALAFFDCGHGDFDADDHWDAGDFLWREPDISATGLGVLAWPSADCVVALAGLLSRGIFSPRMR